MLERAYRLLVVGERSPRLRDLELVIIIIIIRTWRTWRTWRACRGYMTDLTPEPADICIEPGKIVHGLEYRCCIKFAHTPLDEALLEIEDHRIPSCSRGKLIRLRLYKEKL